jgi:hypothetical protein
MFWLPFLSWKLYNKNADIYIIIFLKMAQMGWTNKKLKKKIKFFYILVDHK